MLRVICFCAVSLIAILPQQLSAQSAARGRAVCIGLNVVDPKHYGSELRLSGCRNDAEDLATILRGIRGMEVRDPLLDSAATVQAVEREIRRAAEDLEEGDLFVLTIAAHGSQLPDRNGDEAELDATDRLDETWLLFDRMWIDDERYALWKEFKEGVRIVVVSDTCHAGTTIRSPLTGSGILFMNGFELQPEMFTMMERAGQRSAEDLLRNTRSLQSDSAFLQELLLARERSNAFPLPDSGTETERRGLGRAVGADTRALADVSQRIRSLARQDALALYAARGDEYDPILNRAAVSERSPLGASVILLAACQDYQTAADGDLNGAFTGTLKEIWNEGFTGTYEEFLNKIKRRMYERYFEQTPNYLHVGAVDADFLHRAQRPFSVTTSERAATRARGREPNWQREREPVSEPPARGSKREAERRQRDEPLERDDRYDPRRFEDA